MNNATTEKREIPLVYSFSRFFSTFDMDKLEKILRHPWKDRLKVSKIAQFEIVEN